MRVGNLALADPGVARVRCRVPIVYDVAVVGLGGIGSAVLARCAAAGAKVIGLERFARGHDLGSSSGKSRLIRKAYFEDPAYVPLLLRTYELWRALERESNEQILRITGMLLVGREEGEVISGSRRSALAYDLPIEFLDWAEIRKRYPSLNVRADEVAVFESDGGVLNPERAIAAHLKLAEARGAETRFEGAMTNWTATAAGFELTLADGSQVSARKLVLALGPWFRQTLDSLGVKLRVQRNVQAWFTPTTQIYRADRFPAFLLEREGLPAPLYGFPDAGEGIKAAFHGFGEITEADSVDRAIDPARDLTPLATCLDQWMPGAAGPLREAKVCMYSLTPDQHFVIDRHPQHPGLILCGGFSGHGFKFAPVMGEIATELALKGESAHEIEFLSLRRFAGAPAV
ncbi:MAG: N-methyl-L-tryptophan oxidase [Chthoniobacterales bacterium]